MKHIAEKKTNEMKLKIRLQLAAMLVAATFSCSDDIENPTVIESLESKTQTCSAEVADSLKQDFAKALSAALGDSRELREFLKEKAIEQFDCNYDVLYLAEKEQKVGSGTFQGVMASYLAC